MSWGGSTPNPPDNSNPAKLTRQHEFISEQRSCLLNRDKSGTPGQNGTNWRPGRPLIFFRDLRLKIGTVPENPGRMVTLVD